MVVKLNLSTKPNFVMPELLLHPPIPLALWGTNPRTILGKEWWDATRGEAFAANNDCCWACGVHRLDAQLHNYLDGHECYEYDYERHIAVYVKTVGLCCYCHRFIHFGARPNAGLVRDIMQHGLEVLKGAGLPWPTYQVRWLGLCGVEQEGYELLPGPPRQSLLADGWDLLIPAREIVRKEMIRMDLITIAEEDRKGIMLLDEALDAAFEAGKNDAQEEVPSVHGLWESLMEVIGVKV